MSSVINAERQGSLESDSFQLSEVPVLKPRGGFLMAIEKHFETHTILSFWILSKNLE